MLRRGVASLFFASFLLGLAGFVVLVFFLSQSFGGGQTGRESCHFSVLARATAPLGTHVLPLKCTAEKICITGELFGTCEQFAGEKNVRRVRVNAQNVDEAARVIERESANAMYDCWSMMGEGKIDVFAHRGAASTAASDLFDIDFTFKITRPTCVICSRLALDVNGFSSNENFNAITSRVDANRYMAETQVPGSSLTYLQTFTDRSIGSYPASFLENTDVSSTNELAIVFAQTKTSLSPEEAFKGAAIGSFAIGGAGLLSSAGSILTKVIGAGPALLINLGQSLVTGGFSANSAYQSQMISAAFCGPFGDDEDAKLGCSIVSPVAWNAEKINAFCSGGLEGNL